MQIPLTHLLIHLTPRMLGMELLMTFRLGFHYLKNSKQLLLGGKPLDAKA